MTEDAMRSEARTMSFDKLAAALMNKPRQQSTFLLGIDGGGGAGKSTFAKAIETSFTRMVLNVTIVQMDDFFRPSSEREEPATDGFVDGEVDWRRLLAQVISPIKEDRLGRFQRYDWPSRTLQEWHTVDVGGIVIVEGIRAIRRELTALYDYRIWIQCPASVCLNRGIARDGEKARSRWELDWMPADNRYIEQHRPEDVAELVVDGSGRSDIDPGQFFDPIRAR